MVKQEKLKTGYIKVQLDYAPKTNGKKFREWCEKHGFSYIGEGRRAWCSSLSTYLRGASGIAYADGEAFLFYEEDLIDIAQETNRARINELQAFKAVYSADLTPEIHAALKQRLAKLSKGENK